MKADLLDPRKGLGSRCVVEPGVGVAGSRGEPMGSGLNVLR